MSNIVILTRHYILNLTLCNVASCCTVEIKSCTTKIFTAFRGHWFSSLNKDVFLFNRNIHPSILFRIVPQAVSFRQFFLLPDIFASFSSFYFLLLISNLVNLVLFTFSVVDFVMLATVSDPVRQWTLSST